MFDLKKIVRKNILELSPYSSARDEFSSEAEIYLDANENPFNSGLNRYPDPNQKILKTRIGDLKKIAPENIFTGNGSDEIIDLLIRAFCEPKNDNIIIMQPTYGMYEVSAQINNVEVRKINLTAEFQPDLSKIYSETDKNTKLIFICSPNNPTGNLTSQSIIEELLETFSGLIILDEAYIDFCEEFSNFSNIEKYPNLFVMQTFSKAWGLAGIRLGIGFANKNIINILNKIKAPYNVNNLTKLKALEALKNVEQKNLTVKIINSEKQFLINNLQKISIVDKIYKSDANFLLVKFKENADLIYNQLALKGIVVRNRSKQVLCENSLRITIGTPDENIKLINELHKISKQENEIQSKENQKFHRNSVINRKTRETNIFVELNLDESSENEIITGLGFFDHMLRQIPVHGGFSLKILSMGDLFVDEHHTIEDTAIALGEAFSEALGNKKSIERYGFFLPMDEANAQVSIDFGGRAYLQWNVDFKREKIGDVPVEMFQHFFKSFCDSAKCNLYIKAEGENEHHKIEAVFKAFAKSIKQAVRKEFSETYIASSKGNF